MADEVDVLVIGGGVNGAGVARDAAGRGLSVLLCEKDDLGQGTSSRSSKLVHGGLRYLEYYEFRLVREALIERETLLKIASHIIEPMRFVLPHSPQDRPAWLVRLGLFLYDHIGGARSLPGTQALDLAHAPEGRPLKPEFARAFAYSDCWVDDARLVALNALGAAERGAEVLTRTACVSARREGGKWRVELAPREGPSRVVLARALVNAGGPWVGEIGARLGLAARRAVRLVKGSHVVTRKFWDGPQAYLIQNHDRRVVFVLPYQGDLALVGTTDIPFSGAPEAVEADAAEISYLLAAVNRYFRTPLQSSDVLDAFAGVRPLFDDGRGNPSAVTREYAFDLDDAEGAPALSVFGGKITTYRRLAEQAMGRLAPFFPRMGGDWTGGAPLPGGEIGDFASFRSALGREFPFLPEDLATHYARLYGARARELLGAARALEDLGRRFAPGLYEAEVRYLMRREWARTLEDVVMRRTKHHLRMSAAEKAALAAWLDAAPAPVA